MIPSIAKRRGLIGGVSGRAADIGKRDGATTDAGQHPMLRHPLRLLIERDAIVLPMKLLTGGGGCIFLIIAWTIRRIAR